MGKPAPIYRGAGEGLRFKIGRVTWGSAHSHFLFYFNFSLKKAIVLDQASLAAFSLYRSGLESLLNA
jgi:hypothetical protein